MGPLVYYCRWHRAKLRLAGRDGEAVWGELVYEDGRRERVRYELASRRLFLGEHEARRELTLDERGVIIEG